MDKLKITKLNLEDIYVVEPKPFIDSRGIFQDIFVKENLKISFKIEKLLISIILKIIKKVL